MKKEFSNFWKGSRQPRKQRKFRANAPKHILHKLMSTNLNKKLREKYKKRNIPIVKDDSVKIMKGEYKRKTGKVNILDYKNQRVGIEGIFKSKKDGSKIAVFFDPSNLQIQELNLNDKKRIKALDRKSGTKKEKPIAETKLNKEKQKNAPEKK